jgi:hypothetical protein
MTFWRVLRWCATAAYIALLLASWLGADAPATTEGRSANAVRSAPSFNR